MTACTQGSMANGVCHLVGWLFGWFVSWLVCWLVGWLLGSFSVHPGNVINDSFCSLGGVHPNLIGDACMCWSISVKIS